ncbi:MAG: EF-P lysine aminoacylase GenX [Lentisphaeria bacterium]|nr:EF-P lysine aminoacylase GenX [Lentisphaeria bacterium]
MTPGNFQLKQLIPALKYRAGVLASVRAYCDSRGYCEVETPVGVIAPAAEEYIESPRAGDFFLRTSPELQMKRLLCMGLEKMYQLGPCFRAGENGSRHRSEFTMLEWYQAHATYRDALEFFTGLVRRAAHDANGSGTITFRGETIDLDAPWEIISVREAFRKFAGKNADKLAEEEGLFELVLTEQVEPALPKDRACVLMDYPVRFGAFARQKADDPTLVERWEAYIGGIELANTYGELTDPLIQRERFEKFSQTRKEQGLAEYPEPLEFLDAIDSGMPDATGGAMGFDRLVMLLYGADHIGKISYPLDS